MKSSKYIDDKNSNAINDFNVVGNKDTNSHPFIVNESDTRFVVVNNFSNELNKGQKITLVNQTDINNCDENNFVYAEEIIEDTDDDLYSVENRDRLLAKKKHRTYLEIAKQFDKTIEQNGFVGEIGFNLFSAMRFSKLLFFKNRNSLREEAAIIGATLASPFFEICYEEGKNIATDEKIFDVFAFAKKNLNKPVFVFCGAIPAKEVYEFLRPIYNYIDNPDGDVFMTANGRSILIPKNIYFIYSIKDGDQYFDISRRLLRYSAIVEGNLTRSTANISTYTPFVLSLEELQASFREAVEEFFVEEETWRKLDELVATISSVNGYVLMNKIQRRLEDYLIVLLASNKQILESLDLALANNVISEAIIANNVEPYLTDVDLIDEIEEIFGSSTMKRTIEVIKAYLALFDKKGARI